MQLTEQEIVRRENLQKIIDLGIDPYPSEEFKITAYSDEIKQNFKEGDTTHQDVYMAGRFMSRRIMGRHLLWLTSPVQPILEVFPILIVLISILLPVKLK